MLRNLLCPLQFADHLSLREPAFVNLELDALLTSDQDLELVEK